MTAEGDNTKTTYFWDRVRGAFGGIIETGYMGFALIVAIQVYQAPDWVKGLIAAAGPIGLFLNPLSLMLFAWLKLPAAKLASYVSYLSGGLMMLATFSSGLYGFLIPACLAFAVSSQIMPLLVHIWTHNYPSNKRGAYLAISMMFAIMAHMAFSVVGGVFMENGQHRLIFGVIVAAYFCVGGAIGKMPSTAISAGKSKNPLSNLKYAITDKKFGVMLVSWMFLGFGNLMLLPLRFEYLLQEQYGIQARELVVVTLTLGIPAFMRFVSSRFWGMLFDRIDFMILRMILNALIMLSILLFFTTTNIWVMGVAALVLGAAMGGANISWSLWVTKFTTPDKTAAYMSVHTFTTGIRGIVAPFLGFYLLSCIGATGTGILGSVLISISIVMVFCLYLSQGKRRLEKSV